jgi:hypothetical protein
MASNILLTPNATQQKRALLMCNDTYSQGNRLRYCVNDATDLADKLRCVNCQVTIGTDLICEQMDLMIEEFSNTICSGDLVLFFFSGHGRQLNDQNFLIPVDDDRIRNGIDLKYRAINAQSTLERIMNHRPSAAIFFLDCCCIYMLPNEAGTRGPRSIGGLSTMQPTAGSLIAFACGADKTTLNGSSNGRTISSQLISSHTLLNQM